MTDQNLGDEAAFCRAIDINPDVVKAGSLEIKMQGGKAFVECSIILPVSHALLATAMAAAAGEPKEGPRAVPQDRKPPAKKATARKAPAKKATPKKTS